MVDGAWVQKGFRGMGMGMGMVRGVWDDWDLFRGGSGSSHHDDCVPLFQISPPTLFSFEDTHTTTPHHTTPPYHHPLSQSPATPRHDSQQSPHRGDGPHVFAGVFEEYAHPGSYARPERNDRNQKKGEGGLYGGGEEEEGLGGWESEVVVCSHLFGVLELAV